jgi:hypothetical protein
VTDPFEEGRRIARGLIEASFPARDLHHREHCLASACLIIDQPAVEWERELPGVIRRYNLAMGGANTDEAGYHETLTQFFLGEIRRFLAAHADLSPAAACRALLDSPIAAKDHALTFYSSERLHSRAARLGFVAPDRAPRVADARVVI